VLRGRSGYGDIVWKQLDRSIDPRETSDGQKVGLIFNVGQAFHRVDALPAQRQKSARTLLLIEL
jgi:hypothetical protein